MAAIKQIAKKAGVNPKFYPSRISKFKKISFIKYEGNYKNKYEEVDRYFLSGERGKVDWPRERKKQLSKQILETIISANETRKFVRFEIWIPFRKTYSSWWHRLWGMYEWEKINNGIIVGFTDWSDKWGSNYQDVEVTTGIEFWTHADMENCRVTHLICGV